MNEGMTSAIDEDEELIVDENYEGHEFVGGDIQNDQQSCQGEFVASNAQTFVGMLFETMDEAREHYVEYDKGRGFTIRTRSTSRYIRGSNEITGATFVCSREGKTHKLAKAGVHNVDQESFSYDIDKEKTAKKKRTTSTVKVGCMAHMRVFIDKRTMKWMVTHFDDAHNHSFVTPSKRAKMRPFKEMPKAARDLAEAFHTEGLPCASRASARARAAVALARLAPPQRACSAPSRSLYTLTDRSTPESGEIPANFPTSTIHQKIK